MQRYHPVPTALALIFLCAFATAFSPPPVDLAKVSLCESTNGTVNITIYDPGAGKPDEPNAPRADYAKKTVFRCDCPQGFAWNETAGCALVQPSTLWAKIILFIKKIFVWLL
jgi:hypothetical protein